MVGTVHGAAFDIYQPHAPRFQGALIFIKDGPHPFGGKVCPRPDVVFSVANLLEGEASDERQAVW
jgi:hypothetical protein